MRKIVSHLIMTLDGVVKFEAVMETIARLRDQEVQADFFTRVAEEDAMLLGRVTYQEWADYWPSSTHEPFASHINNVPKYVVSRTLEATPWGERGNATLIKGDLGEAIMRLKEQPGKNIGIHGSPELVGSMLHADLLDELRLEIYPLVAGSGGRLFHEEHPPKKLHLTDARIAKNGVAILTYRTKNDL